MSFTKLKAYERMEKLFNLKGYTRGINDDMPIFVYSDSKDLTPGHYVNAISYGKISFVEIPEKMRTREFFLHALSGAYEELVDYVKKHPKEFDKQFFKDHIETNSYALNFTLNDFEYMPLEYIDEEMVMCAMLKAVGSRFDSCRGKQDDWFYSVQKRKPEILTKDMYIIGARCFARRLHGKNKFLSVTPEEFKTEEYYYALCLGNDNQVMEDIPDSILTVNFLNNVLKDSVKNIASFSEHALEMETKLKNKGNVKFWQAAVIMDGHRIGDIPLNDERIEFFLSHYDKDSSEYIYSFKDRYKQYIREKNSISKPYDSAATMSAIATLFSKMSGDDNDTAIDFGSTVAKRFTDHNGMLPINNNAGVPYEYMKKYDSEEYLLEIYKKLGIQVIDEADYFYYNVVFPENISVSKGEFGYLLKDSEGKTLIRYTDRGPFYDREVKVIEINVTL